MFLFGPSAFSRPVREPRVREPSPLALDFPGDSLRTRETPPLNNIFKQ